MPWGSRPRYQNVTEVWFPRLASHVQHFSGDNIQLFRYASLPPLPPPSFASFASSSSLETVRQSSSKTKCVKKPEEVSEGLPWLEKVVRGEAMSRQIFLETTISTSVCKNRANGLQDVMAVLHYFPTRLKKDGMQAAIPAEGSSRSRMIWLVTQGAHLDPCCLHGPLHTQPLAQTTHFTPIAKAKTVSSHHSIDLIRLFCLYEASSSHDRRRMHG
jgi:hypothetical protein